MKNFLLIMSLLASSVCFAQTSYTQKINLTSTVYDTVDQMPQFPGGAEARHQYITKNVRYPTAAVKEKIDAKVYVSFIVDEKGKVVDSYVVNHIGYGIDEEALRVINSMPPFKPGKKNGKKVKVRLLEPISFKYKSGGVDVN